MRATEFVFESHHVVGKVKKRASAVQQSIQKSRDKGGYDRTHHMNRIWMATAMADGQSKKPVEMDSYSWVEKYNTQHPYTEEEYNEKMDIYIDNLINTDISTLEKQLGIRK